MTRDAFYKAQEIMKDLESVHMMENIINNSTLGWREDEDAPNNITEITLGSVRNFLKDFPPVTPAHKKGHWIMKHRTHNEMKHYTGQDEMGETHTISVFERYEADEPYCSECGKLAGDTSQNYCCACGAEMQGVEE